MKLGRLVPPAALLCFLSVTALSGQRVLRDPVIPDGETAVYIVREGDEQYSFVEEVSVFKENERDIYGFTYRSENETTEVKVERRNMLPFSVRSVTVGNGISIDSSTLLSFESEYRTEGVAVLTFTDLKYVLRGYPFGETDEELGIVFINTGDEAEEQSSDFTIRVSYVGIERLPVNGRTIACHKVELKMAGSGIMRVLKPFIPKTYFWFSVDRPHYLVAYEGSSSFPGSPKRYVEILDYSGWN